MWKKPREGELKLNFDAAWCASSSKEGYAGWLIRDNAEMFIAGGCKGGEHFNSAKEAEADAVREGLRYVKDRRLSCSVCEGDAQKDDSAFPLLNSPASQG